MTVKACCSNDWGYTNRENLFKMKKSSKGDFFMRVNLPAALKSLKPVKFLQPLIEAVCNSLEAHATEITVTLTPSIVPAFQFKDKKGKLLTENENVKKIDGFIITDNGDGFTGENIISFDTYLSSYKKEIGCKGIGRLTWLKVFKNISIESYTKEEKISFVFEPDFNLNDIKKEKKENHPSTGTTITFSSITDAYYTKEKDKRFDADVYAVADVLKSEILSKLFFMKKEGKNFLIKIQEGDSECILTPEIVPEFSEKQFKLSSRTQNFEEDFKLYYSFNPASKGIFKGFLCADNRAVEPFDFKVSVPKKEEVFMFLTSPYLDQHCNNERNEFDLSNEENLTSPITLDAISSSVKNEATPVIFERYPILEEKEKDVVNKCLDDYPYLSKYINDRNNTFNSESDIIKNAEKSFKEDKKDAQSRFAEILKNAEIDDTEYRKVVSEITDLSARELAEYFAFRQQIIQGLKDCVSDKSKLEKHMHTLFMPMQETVIKNENESVPYSHNLWLLDDKFMSCFHAASDETINKICKAAQREATYKPRKEPDLALFFSHADLSYQDAVVIEFKGNYANDDEKAKAIVEIKENIRVVRKNFPEINTVWGYAITKIDETLASRLEDDDYKCLFSTEGCCKIYYHYYENRDAHVYFMDSETIALEAEKRNKLFLDIMRGNIKE